ncbi:MAG: hypothetical protein HND52_01615 [Ignavibacteriae bacterium]|nr:hypothetical protein [Ignavibacteriota bacterium]NOG96648.1 hypothetical protein [Ignavibacteriota bacterium]
MKLVIPQNIYSAFFALSLDDKQKENVISKPSSLITKSIQSGEADIALIPSLDLINNRELFVSQKIAISFDGFLSNAYLYFKPNQNDFKNLFLQGDVSANEVILSKIIFSEMYDSQVEIKLDTEETKLEKFNYLICGDENYNKKLMNKGLSFADEIAEYLDFPYTNYLLAAKNENALTEFTQSLTDLDKKVEDNIGNYLDKMQYQKELTETLKANINSVYFELTDNEIDGLNELLRLPFFHGIIEEVVEINYV